MKNGPTDSVAVAFLSSEAERSGSRTQTCIAGFLDRYSQAQSSYGHIINANMTCICCSFYFHDKNIDKGNLKEGSIYFLVVKEGTQSITVGKVWWQTHG